MTQEKNTSVLLNFGYFEMIHTLSALVIIIEKILCLDFRAELFSFSFKKLDLHASTLFHFSNLILEKGEMFIFVVKVLIGCSRHDG